MANYLTTDTDLIAVADAIRERGNTTAALMYPDEYITAILNIPSGNNTSIIEYADSHGGTVIELTAVDLSQDTVAPQYLLSGYTAHNRSGEAITGTLTLTERTSSDLTVSGATVTVPAGYYSAQASKAIDNANLVFDAINAQNTNIGSTNGNLTLTSSSVNLTLSGSSTNGYISRPSGGVIGTVSLFAQSNIPYYTSSSAPITISTNTITIPSGYYHTQITKSVDIGTVTAPSSISGTSATVSTGTNTLTLTKTVSVTPNVTTAGYISAGTASNASVSLTASVTTKAAATITPGTSNKTIAAGTYLTGTQTISGDADLVASNIISTANIFGVQGNVVINKYYTGSSAPSASLGNNGDIYLQTS